MSGKMIVLCLILIMIKCIMVYCIFRLWKKKRRWKDLYDFLDGSPLVEPVNLVINHPVRGVVILKVNKETAIKYIDPIQRSTYFPNVISKSAYRQCLINCESIHAHTKSTEGFDIVNGRLIHDMLVDRNTNVIKDLGFAMGRGGHFEDISQFFEYFIDVGVQEIHEAYQTQREIDQTVSKAVSCQ